MATTVTATDSIFRKGTQFSARAFTGLIRPKNRILGDVLAGEIEAVGPEVTSFKPGDQVFGSSGTGFGAHTEYICLPEDGALAIKPANLTYDEAVAVYDGTLTALPFLRDTANIEPGQKVLINGASGSIGTAAVQLAKYFEADVTGVCSKANVELVKSLGADNVIDYTQEDFTEGDERYDVIFDAVGKMISGLSKSKCQQALNSDGVYLSVEMNRPDHPEDLTFLAELVTAREIRPVIDRQYPIEEIVDAHHYVETLRKKGNVILIL